MDQYLKAVVANFQSLRASRTHIEDAAAMCIASLREGGKVILCGNGGSAADSQHLAAELMGRFLFDRNPLPALALTVDTSALTAIGNDYGYDDVFARQLRGIGRKGDVIVGLSTSGKSRNVLRAFEVAEELGIKRIALTGASVSPMSDLAEVAVMVPSRQTNYIQEMHIAVGHIICGIVEETLCSAKL
ncbi:phosphoheptose isomerase [Thioclava sp. F34-6]|nr:phosphoheptose isomerase [Thioclava sp. F34-6]